MFSRDWFLVRYEIWRMKLVGSQFKLVCELCELLAASGPCSATAATLRETISRGWAACMYLHICLPTAIGSKHASIAHKVHVLLHALAIKVGNWAMVHRLCSAVFAVTTDMGYGKVVGSDAQMCVAQKLPSYGC